VRRISCMAFLCWFEIACRLASVEKFVAFDPHVPRETLKLETQRHRQSNLNPNHYATLLPPLESVRHPYGYGREGNHSLRCASARVPAAKELPLRWAHSDADAARNCANLPTSTLEKRP
jgi:hypothetical protein